MSKLGLTGHPVTYVRLAPVDMGMTFEEVFNHARNTGFTGLNITYPYKERAVPYRQWKACRRHP